ncbi:hypothetical protein PM082_010688 [Marasmius tenuissimus]|nr:hypothetical protein PM082_010688 [Marasmius tenuissimus]
MPRPTAKRHEGQSQPDSTRNNVANLNSGSTPPLNLRNLANERAQRREARAKQRTETRERLKNEGNDFFKQGRYLDAAEKYEEAVNLGGKKPVLMTNLAAAYLKLGLFEQAEDVCTDALIYDPTNVKARYRRGLARKGLLRAKGAIKDFETIQKHAPEVASELRLARQILKRGDNTFSDGEYTHKEYIWPPYKEACHELKSDSGLSDCEHIGNGVSCKYYNQGRCTRGQECAYSHAPDDRSVRDKLGRNVCLFHLFTSCEFGSTCMYSHDKTYLPAKGWWDDEALMNKIFEDVLFTRLKACARGEDEREVVDLVHRLIYQYGGNIPRNLDVISRQGTPGHALNIYLKESEKDDTASRIPISALAAVASSSALAISNRFVMLVSLRGENRAQDDHKHVVSTLREKVRVKQALTMKTALSWVTSRDLSGILITDFGIADAKNRPLLLKIVEYAKAGGLVVAGGQFGVQISGPNMGTFFRTWDLPWERGSYEHLTLKRNAGSDTVKKNPSLPLLCTMRAVHLRGMHAEDAVYLPVSNADSPLESPLLHTRIGKGYFGFIGDVRGEEMTDVLYAFLGLLDSAEIEDPPNFLQTQMRHALLGCNPLYDSSRLVRRAGIRTWTNTMTEGALEQGMDKYMIRDLLRGF